MAKDMSRKAVPFSVGGHEFIFRELTIDDLDRVNVELRRMFLKNCEIQLSILELDATEVAKMRRVFLTEASKVNLYSPDGQSLLASIDGMIVLCWACLDTPLPLKEFRDLIHRAKPTDAELKTFTGDITAAFNSVMPSVHKSAPGDPTTNP